MKKDLLIIFGVGDLFCSKDSFRGIKSGPRIEKEVSRLVKEGNHFGYVAINESSDSFKRVDPFRNEENRRRVIDVKLCSDDVFNLNNQITVYSTEGNTETILDGNQLDFVIPPEKYNLCVAGIDINGIFMKFIPQIEQMGYDITVYSDIIKPFTRDTIEMLTTRARNKETSLQFRKS